ncbi:hypothetical protein ACEPAH_812 [Sanghuangporus vaninii]
MFDPSTLPRRAGQILLVSDKLEAPAEFIILSILTSHLKQALRRKSILVSFSQVFSHWSSVASRLSPPSNLSSYASKGSFVFIDVLSQEFMSPASSLRSLYDKLNELLETSQANNIDDVQPNLVVLDGLSLVEWSGSTLLEVKRFVRALRALCNRCNAALVIRHHRVTSDNLDDLHRALLCQCSLHVEVLPLASGRSSAISGEITLHAGPLLDDPKSVTTISRSAAVQYRLRDSGATYFGRGTSALVL